MFHVKQGGRINPPTQKSPILLPQKPTNSHFLEGIVLKHLII